MIGEDSQNVRLDSAIVLEAPPFVGLHLKTLLSVVNSTFPNWKLQLHDLLLCYACMCAMCIKIRILFLGSNLIILSCLPNTNFSHINCRISDSSSPSVWSPTLHMHHYSGQVRFWHFHSIHFISLVQVKSDNFEFF
jgi:hypothetical protein